MLSSADLVFLAKCGWGPVTPRYETEVDSVDKLVGKGLLEYETTRSDPRPLLDNPHRSVHSVRLSHQGAATLEGILKILNA